MRQRHSRALCDDAQKILRTVPRRGYIFASKPAAIADQSGSLSTADASGLPDKPSIAVLAFTNMNGDIDQEYFSDGIADDIISEPAHSRSLFVIARNSSFTYKGRSVDVEQIARELGMRYVVEGSVCRSAGRGRVNAQLIDATTGNHIWAERYDRQISEIFDLQDEITEAVVTAIQPAVGDAEQLRTLRKPPVRSVLLHGKPTNAAYGTCRRGVRRTTSGQWSISSGRQRSILRANTPRRSTVGGNVLPIIRIMLRCVGSS